MKTSTTLHLKSNEQMAVNEYIARIQDRFEEHIVAVMLFGSKARGDPDIESDLDLDRFLDGYEAVAIGVFGIWNTGIFPSLGDVDQNSVWDNADSQLTLNFFGNAPTVSEFDPGRTDVDRNGVIDNADSQWSLNFFGKGTPYLPVE